MRRGLFIVLLVMLTACTMPSGAPVVPQIIATANAQFAVPGKAFLDGRRLDATPLATTMTIAIGDAVPRTMVMCRMGHGDAVQLRGAIRSDQEQRWYFRIESGYCNGWIAETYLSTTRQPALGMLLP